MTDTSWEEYHATGRKRALLLGNRGPMKFDDSGNETKTDFFRMLKIVYESDFSGVISIEFEGHDVDPIAGALKTKALIEKALEAAAT